MWSILTAGVIGFVIGYLAKVSIFAKNNGLGGGAALVLCAVSWMILVLALSLYAELELGYDKQPAWAGISAFFFSGGLWMGIKRTEENN